MSATELRDGALESVVSAHWRETALNFLSITTLPDEFTGEDIRLALTEAGLPKPRHHNAWGGFTMGLVRSGRIKANGKFANMKTDKSHARMTRLYTLVNRSQENG